MTITSAVRKAGPYPGNGVTTTFPFNFKVFKKEDVAVTFTDANGVDSSLTLDSDYSVLLNGDQDNNPGGTITYPRSGSSLSNLQSEQKLTLSGGLAYTQPTDIPNLSQFFPQVVEDALDRAEIQIQQVKEITDRSVKVGVSDDPLAPLPGNLARANMVLGFDAVGGLTLLPLPSSIGAGDRIPFTFTAGADFTSGVTTQLVLPRAPGVPGNLEVFFDPLFQGFDQWSVADLTLTFSSPIPPGVTKVFGYIGTTLSTEVPPPNSISDANVTAGAGIQSSKLAFPQSGTGAISRTVESRLRDSVSVFDFLTSAQIADVQAFTYATDPTAGIQKAIDYASTTGKYLDIPAGGYNIIPATAVTSEAGAETAAFLMRSNMHIRAEKGAVFKLAPNQSTDAAPKALEMFFTNQVLNNVSIRGLTMDMNGANNKVSPGRPATYDVSKDMAMVCVSGTPGGVAARITRCTIEDCTFQNTPGVCCILLAGTNTVGATLGNRWRLLNNTFLNNGTDTSDHTSVFGWADDVIALGNVFWQDNHYATVGKTGGVTAFEVHGSNHQFTNNYVQNYLRGMWVGPNYTGILDNVLIANNIFLTDFFGVDFFRYAVAQTTSRNTLINGNIFNISDTTYSGAPTQKNAINISPDYFVGDIKITNNIALKTGGSVSSAFVTIANGALSGVFFDRIHVEHNKASGFCFGVNVVCSATSGVNYLSIDGNRWENMIPAGVTGISAGTFINGAAGGIATLVIGSNYAIDTNPAGNFYYGLYISGTINDFYLGPQYNKGMGVSNYFENASNIGKRKGFFENISFTPTITAGVSTMSLGDGSLTASYSMTNDLVEVDIKLTVRAGTSFGAGGNLAISLPFTAEGTDKIYLGNWREFDGATFNTGVAALAGTTNSLALNVNGGSLVSSTAPMVLNNGKILSTQITYRKAA